MLNSRLLEGRYSGKLKDIEGSKKKNGIMAIRMLVAWSRVYAVYKLTIGIKC
jgi:hypothetical protein